MNTARNKGFSVGSVVAINGDLDWLYPACVNLLWEVRDGRLANGEYLYTLSTVGAGAMVLKDVPVSDLHEVK